ncbi:MAG: ubiquitin-like domain-containing protein [archaeon]|nr:ubiquitin-like domain-containing protein [archaeon]
MSNPFGDDNDPFGSNENPFGDQNSGNNFGGADSDPFAQNNEPQQELGNGEFIINIKNVNGDSTSYTVNGNMTIKELIQQYRSGGNIQDRAKVILTYQGKILKESEKISTYNIDAEETLHALIRLQGGC